MPIGGGRGRRLQASGGQQASHAGHRQQGPKLTQGRRDPGTQGPTLTPAGKSAATHSFQVAGDRMRVCVRSERVSSARSACVPGVIRGRRLGGRGLVRARPSAASVIGALAATQACSYDAGDPTTRHPSLFPH